MKKIIWIVILMLTLPSLQMLSKYAVSPALAQTKGNWMLVEAKVLETVTARPPLSTKIEGSDGHITCTATYEKASRIEKAVFNWNWTVPPSQLKPGDEFMMTISGLIKEWDTTHFLNGSLQVRLQPFGASCCSLEGSDLGYLSLDPNSGDIIGKEKQIETKTIIPRYGDLNSNTTNKFQILVKLLQNGTNHQWIYVFEWKKISDNPVSIQLTIGSSNALVNNEIKYLDSPPFIKNNRTYVPFRFLGESFGAKVSYKSNPVTKLVENISYQLGEIKITLTINQPEAIVNNKTVQLDAPALIVNQRTMVPVRFIAEQLEAKVNWDSMKQQILIEKE